IHADPVGLPALPGGERGSGGAFGGHRAGPKPGGADLRAAVGELAGDAGLPPLPGLLSGGEGGAHPLLLRRAVPDLGPLPAGEELGRPAAGMERLESAALRLPASWGAVPLLPGPRHAGGRDRRLPGGPGAAGARRQDGGGVVAFRTPTTPTLIGPIRRIRRIGLILGTI